MILTLHLGLFGIFLSFVIENIGVPFPTEAAFLLGNYYIAIGRYSFLVLFEWIFISQIIGATIAYWVGRLIGKKLFNQSILKNKLFETRTKVIVWYERYGSITIFATRLIGYVRPWSSIVAGIAEVPFHLFLIWTILGTLAFTAVTMLITKYVANIWQLYPNGRVILIIAGVILFFGLTIFSALRARLHARRSKIV
jgi:membrane protein DedA with SNARE-associated domain